MSQPVDQITLADQIRLAVAEQLAAVATLSAQSDVPFTEGAETQEAAAVLRANRYKVLVCGEAKRGKSTFINALLGKPLLPTDIDIATAQVFEIRHGETETATVRFEDGTERQIGMDQLGEFGSQMAQDRPGYSRPEGTVLQIELTVPSRYLPPEITLYDTPGLGSLYSGHAKITYRFVPQADAVIFVLDSNAPITKPELSFLESILEVTPHVFFLQTRIDQVRQEDWQSVLERNRELLSKRIADPPIFPISSILLENATRTGRPELLQASRFPPMLSALRNFLFRATGIAKTRRYAKQLLETHTQVRTVLDERIQAVLTRARGNQEEFQKRQTERNEAMRENWAPGSRGRRTTDEKLRDIVDDARADFMSALAPRSSIETELQGLIDAMKDIKEAEPVAARVAQEVVERIQHRWYQVTGRAMEDVTDVIRPLSGGFRCDTALITHLASSAGIETLLAQRTGNVVRVKSNVLSRLRSAWQESGVLMGIGGAAAILTGGVLAVPIAIFTLSTAGIGLLSSGERLADQAKPQLSQYLQRILSDVRLFYTETDTGAGKSNRVQGFFRELERAARRALDDEYERRLAENKKETETLRTMATSTEAEGNAILTATRKSITAWDEFARRIDMELQALDRIEATPITAPTITLPVATVAAVTAPPAETVTAPTNPDAEQQFREIAQVSALDGVLSPREGEMLRAKAAALQLAPERAQQILREEFAKAKAVAKPVVPEPAPAPKPAVPPVTPTVFREAFREALVSSIASGEPIPDATQESLDNMADLLRLPRAAVRSMETALRAEIQAVPAAQESTSAPSPAERYGAWYAEALTRGSGEVLPADTEALDTLADELGLSRAETRRIEREQDARHITPQA